MGNRFKDALLGVVVLSLALLVLSWLSGCSSLREERDHRATRDAKDVTAQALCPALPVCEIPWGSNAKQLQEALWSCVLEYRALYSQCAHGVAVSPPVARAPKPTPGTGYGVAYCLTVIPPQCFDAKGAPL